MSSILNLVLLKGGGGSEHEISLRSAQFLEQSLRQAFPQASLSILEQNQHREWSLEGAPNRLPSPYRLIELLQQVQSQGPTYLIPCFHGAPGETGEIQAFLDGFNLPYLGCGSEASVLCMNKVSTKLWAERLGIPTTPFTFCYDLKEGSQKALDFFNKYQSVFIKASSQGSSVGVYEAHTQAQVLSGLEQAAALAPYVLIEKKMKARELEVAAFEYQGQLHLTLPGEIICGPSFYTYEEKYAAHSQSTTHVTAQNLSPQIIEQLRSFSRLLFLGLKLKDLCRIDFFLGSDQQLYLNEINTFPGMTSISLFPQMMAAAGVSMPDFLLDRVNEGLKKTN